MKTGLIVVLERIKGYARFTNEMTITAHAEVLFEVQALLND